MKDCPSTGPTRLMMVGQAPSRETAELGLPPFHGRCGAFLAGLMGLTQKEMLERHDFLNVLNYWPGKGVGGDKFPATEAAIAAKKMLPTLRGRAVVLLGANVAKAFGARSFRYLERYEIRNPENSSDIVVPLMAVVPHPSGVNRYWNSEENRLMAIKFFAELCSVMDKHQERIIDGAKPEQVDRQNLPIVGSGRREDTHPSRLPQSLP